MIYAQLSTYSSFNSVPFVSFRYLFDYFLFLLIQCILKEKTSIYSYSWISPSLIYHGYFFFHLWLTGCIHSLTKLKGSWVTVLIRRFYFGECSFIFIYLLEKGLLHFLIGSFTWMSSFFKRFFFFLKPLRLILIAFLFVYLMRMLTME